jgi:hypothetical protein
MQHELSKINIWKAKNFGLIDFENVR